MDLVEKHQQVEFPLIGTNMKRGYFAGCTMSKILLLSSFNDFGVYQPSRLTMVHSINQKVNASAPYIYKLCKFDHNLNSSY